jgi:hypothetical protein
MIEALKKLVKNQVNDATFEEKWEKIIEDSVRWESSPTGSKASTSIVRLQFLEKICAAYPKAELYKNPEIVDLILSDSGVRSVGFNFKCALPNQGVEMATIIRREITEKFGILFTIETAEGFRFTREFYD